MCYNPPNGGEWRCFYITPFLWCGHSIVVVRFDKLHRQTVKGKLATTRPPHYSRLTSSPARLLPGNHMTGFYYIFLDFHDFFYNGIKISDTDIRTRKHEIDFKNLIMIGHVGRMKTIKMVLDWRLKDLPWIWCYYNCYNSVWL